MDELITYIFVKPAIWILKKLIKIIDGLKARIKKHKGDGKYETE